MRQQEQQTHDVRNHHDELNHRDDPDRHDDPDQVHRPDSTFERRDEEASGSGAYPADRSEAGGLDGAEPRDRVDEADRVDHVSTADDDGERTFHQPAPVPTAFGAPTVGGAVAASALAGESRAKPDPRQEETVRAGDGSTGDTAVGDTATHDGAVDGSTTVGAARPVHRTEGILAAGAPETDADDRIARDLETGDGAMEDGAPLPGAVPTDPVTALVSGDAAQGFRDRWRDVQLRFVDDPQGATTEARDLVSEVVDSLTAALTAQRDELDTWENGDAGDTERLRVAVRRYRDLVDRLLSL